MSTNALKLARARERRANGQGSIYWSEGRKRWVASAFDIHGVRHARFFKLKKDAENWTHDQRIARERGSATFSATPKSSVAEYLNQWLEQVKGNLRPNTYRNYKGTIKRIEPFIGKLNASKLTPIAIEKLQSDLLANGLGAGTVKGAYRVLSAAYRYGVKMEIMPSNPVAKVRMARVATKSTKQIPIEDYKLILAMANQNHYLNARILVGLTLGLRPGEVAGLKWSDIDWRARTITIERQVQRVIGKGLVFQAVKQNAIRTVPISDHLYEALEEHQFFQQNSKDDWEEDHDVIFNGPKGKLLDTRLDWDNWKRYLEDLGLPHYELRQMRKTCFTLMARETDIKTLMQFSGHTQISTVLDSYVYTAPEVLHKAVSAIDKLHPIVDEDLDYLPGNNDQEDLAVNLNG